MTAAARFPLAQLHLAWPILWPMLEAAVKRSPDFSQAQPGARPDLLAELLAERAQLWGIGENGQAVAGVVTKITTEPEKRCLLWLVGGSRVKEWAADFMATVEPWARSQGCVAVWGCGRKGWARIVPLFGGAAIADHNGMPAWERKIA